RLITLYRSGSVVAQSAVRCNRLLAGLRSPNYFDLARSPALVEEGFERTIEAQDHEPALVWHGLDPVAALDGVGLLGTEVHRRRAVGVRLGGGRWITLAAGARIALRRVEHRARLVVV